FRSRARPACGIEPALRLTRGALEHLQALHDLLDLLRSGLQRVLRFLHLEALAALLLVDRRQLLADRLAPPFGLLRALHELEVFDFEVVAFLAARVELLA